MLEDHSIYRTDKVLKSTVIKALSHLVKHYSDFNIMEDELCILSNAIFILDSLPRLVNGSPFIFIELHIPDLPGYNGFNLTIDNVYLEIGMAGFEQNEYGGDSFSTKIVDINLEEFSETLLVNEYDNLKEWADVFVNSDFECELTIQSNTTLLYSDCNLYDSSEGNDDLEDDLGEFDI